ncbi:hypothetical protein [Aeromonas veronii]|uniref:hypothetical protein n=1 Tax=Aeromonas veronii TaxID=654 RepID=UPI000F5D8B5C|nr:hypothetical protein [Aeromonas veronii]
MSNSRYKSRYTACGRSFNKLRNDAKALKKNCGLTLRQSLDKIARDINYSNWDELANQKPNMERDRFFQFMYDNENSRLMNSEYMKFLNKKSLSDNCDNYRRFICVHWDLKRKTFGASSEILQEPMDPFLFINNLRHCYNKFGAVCFMPQNMTNEMLQTVTLGAQIFLGDIKNIPDDIQNTFVDTTLICVHGIKSYQTSTNYAFSNKELIENITTYYRLCGLEHLSRTSNIKVSLPSIDTIFTENAMLQLKIPPEMPNPCDWYN